MSKELPNIFVNPIKKEIHNQKEIYYSKKEDRTNYPSKQELMFKINRLFKSNNFVYKKKLDIFTKNGLISKDIIGKSSNYLLAIDNTKIYYNEIIDIN